MSENKIKLPNIPIETQQRMHAFFMKTSIPRIYKERLEEEQRRKEVESQQNENEDKK